MCALPVPPSSVPLGRRHAQLNPTILSTPVLTSMDSQVCDDSWMGACLA